MNILLINHYAGSPELGMEFRPFYLGREWARLGHQVTILSASFAHVRKSQPPISGDFSEEMISGIRYVWFKTPAYQGNGVGRVVNMIIFVIKLFFYASRISKKFKPDVVIASSTYPLDNYPACRIAKKGKGIFVYEVHDLWPLSPIELGGYSRKHPFIRIMQAAENYAYKHVDLLISMLPKTKEYMLSHGLEPAKWHYIPNGIDPDEWEIDLQLHEDHTSILNRVKQEGKKIIGYTGSIGIANALDNLIHAAEICEDKSIMFVIVGDGPEKRRLQDYIRKMQMTNVMMLDPVPKSGIPSILSICDILYIGLQKQSLFRFGISPNKLLDYMMAGKPVVQSISAGNDIVSDARCGITIDPENPEALVNAIKSMLALPEEERKKLGENGRQYVIKNHDYRTLAENIVSIFKNKLSSAGEKQ